MKLFEYIAILLALIAVKLDRTESATGVNQLETCEDEKCYKNLLKTRPNLLILFSRSDLEVKGTVKLLKEVYAEVINYATVAYINCEKVKKICKKLKVNPEPSELKHFSDGVFNKDYDRPMVKKSLVSFLKDPKGDMPWDEEDDTKDIVHIQDENGLNKLLKKKVGILVMFYAPWCGFCKKLKPQYAEAATELKPNHILAAMNVDTAENSGIRRIYNITGFPTLIYFKNGNQQFNYGGEYTKDSLVEWMKNPHPPKEKESEPSWADEEDVHVTFLTDDTFDEFLETNSDVLVKFYAPWCGHCKNMKPVFNRVAERLKEEGSPNKIAFVDATKQTKLAERFKIKSFPTIKFFKNGIFAFEYNERNEEKILEFMRNPVEPPPKEEEPEWKDEKSEIVHADATNFASTLKTKKHALAFFYAPWCGHCKNAKPHFSSAAEHFKEDPKVAFVAVDCTKSEPLCEQYNVKGFPTIIYFNFGKNQKPYEGMREEKDFIKFMKNPNGPIEKPDPREEWLEIAGNQHVNFLDDSTFDEFIKSKRRAMVMFYAPWCGHCTQMKPAYAQAASEITSFVPGSYLAAVDATKCPKLSQMFNLQGFPTLKFFENGEFKFDYNGGRSKEDFVNFMRDPKQPKAEL